MKRGTIRKKQIQSVKYYIGQSDIITAIIATDRNGSELFKYQNSKGIGCDPVAVEIKNYCYRKNSALKPVHLPFSNVRKFERPVQVITEPTHIKFR